MPATQPLPVDPLGEDTHHQRYWKIVAAPRYNSQCTTLRGKARRIDTQPGGNLQMASRPWKNVLQAIFAPCQRYSGLINLLIKVVTDRRRDCQQQACCVDSRRSNTHRCNQAQ